jgi:hypothetical protein
MVIKYNNILYSKTLQIYQNWDFWFENKPSSNLDPKYFDHNSIRYGTVELEADIQSN